MLHCIYFMTKAMGHMDSLLQIFLLLHINERIILETDSTIWFIRTGIMESLYKSIDKRMFIFAWY